VGNALKSRSVGYEISFERPAGSLPDEFHQLEIKVAKPGLKARTRENYYAQVSTARNNALIEAPSQGQSAKNER
jgi:hypothetical protein